MEKKKDEEGEYDGTMVPDRTMIRIEGRGEYDSDSDEDNNGYDTMVVRGLILLSGH